MLLNVYIIYKRPLSVQAQQSRSCHILSSSCYNSSLVIWTVVCLTAAKFKPLAFLGLHSDLNGLLYSVSVSKETSITQRWAGFRKFISMETRLPIRSLVMGLHVTINYVRISSIIYDDCDKHGRWRDDNENEMRCLRNKKNKRKF
jgi:hypothetical protein